MTLVHVQREFAGVTIRQREDGYFSATDLCKAAGKLWADYFRLDSTQEFLQALSLDMEIPISVKNPSQRNPITELIQVSYGRRLIGGAKLQIRNFAAALKVPLPEKDPRSTSIPYNPAEEAANDA